LHVTEPDILAVFDHTIDGDELKLLLTRCGPARVTNFADLPVVDSAEAALVVVHVDLANKETVDSLRQSLSPRANPDRKLIFITEPSHRFDMQARGLGASAVVYRPASEEKIARALAKLAPPYSAAQHNCAVGKGMAAARDAIDDIFDAAKWHRAVDLDVVTAAADTIDQAIRSAGVHEWVATVRQHHQGTYQHCLLVAGVCSGFCNALGFRPADRERMLRGAILHDVGKSYIPLHILDKPGRLDPGEREIIEMHPRLGADLLLKFHCKEKDLIDLTLHHHEHLDGSGYPDRLSGAEISDPVRLLTISDIYSALVEKRSYKAALEPAAAVGIMEGMSGKLDPDLMRAFRPFVTAGEPPAAR
jgi:putative nucleotidyltransferase with HDIG domain